MKKVTKAVYVSDDGQTFATEHECYEHEQKIFERAKRTTYWHITHSPDLTEGRGYYGSTKIEVYGPAYNADTWVLDWCFRTYGRPLEFVQGASPIPNWEFRKIEAKDYALESVGRIGDTQTKMTRYRLQCGRRGEGLVVVPE